MTPTPDDGSGPLDVDAAFAEIVARWGDDARSDDAAAVAGDPDERDGRDTDGRDADGRNTDGRSGDRTGPEATGTTADGPGRHAMPPPVRPEAEARTVRPAQPLPPAPREDVPPTASTWGEHVPRPATRDGAADDLDPAELAFLDERFVPEEPRPLPRDLVGWAAWAAVVGAPLFLLVVALAWRDVPQLVTAATAAVFVAGFATLVVRLPRSRDEDDDDGAVV